MKWPPRVGETLPRSADAWCVPEKWADWILADPGHGPEWAHVLRVESDNWEQAWQALKEAVREAPIQMVRIPEGGRHLLWGHGGLAHRGAVGKGDQRLALRSRGRGATAGHRLPHPVQSDPWQRCIRFPLVGWSS